MKSVDFGFLAWLPIVVSEISKAVKYLRRSTNNGFLAITITCDSQCGAAAHYSITRSIYKLIFP